MKVRRVIPLEGKRGSYGNPAFEENSCPSFVMCEVGNAYNCFFAYSKGFVEREVWLSYLLEGLV